MRCVKKTDRILILMILLLFQSRKRADAAVSIGETQSRTRNVIATLPIEQTEVVRLFFYEDKPHGETAQERYLPLGTVKSRLRLAMRSVRTALGEAQ